MAEKITKREKNELLIAVLNGKVLTNDEKDMLISHLNHEIELLSRKSKSSKPTPAQQDAMAISEIVKDILCEVEGKGMTVGALLKAEPIKSFVRYNGEGISSQLLTAILSGGAVSEDNPNGAFLRTVEKKVPYYALNYGVEG